MEFAILFILAFLIGLAIYGATSNWLVCVAVPIVLFVLSTVADQGAREAWAFSLIFGVPIVFFASLLGAYVVQLRVGEVTEEPLTPDEDL